MYYFKNLQFNFTAFDCKLWLPKWPSLSGYISLKLSVASVRLKGYSFCLVIYYPTTAPISSLKKIGWIYIAGSATISFQVQISSFALLPLFKKRKRNANCEIDGHSKETATASLVYYLCRPVVTTSDAAKYNMILWSSKILNHEILLFILILPTHTNIKPPFMFDDDVDIDKTYKSIPTTTN